jgi:hypothetical protein
MSIPYYIGQEIVFTNPYFESLFFFHAEILEIKTNSFIVKYAQYIEDNQGSKCVVFNTEIPIKSVVN